MPDGARDGSPTVVYIHGAGRQDPVPDLKKAFDDALFGGPGPSVVARYSQAVWKEPGLDDVREAEIEAIATGAEPAVVRADRIIAITPRKGDVDLPADAFAQARGLVTTFLEQADEVQAAMAPCEPPELIASLRFRFLAGLVGSDVVGYLYLGWGPDMRAPVLDVFRQVDDPIIVVAHSLGTILGYDVLCLPEFAGRRIRLPPDRGLATRARRGARPAERRQWAGLAAQRDPVVVELGRPQGSLCPVGSHAGRRVRAAAGADRGPPRRRQSAEEQP